MFVILGVGSLYTLYNVQQKFSEYSKQQLEKSSLQTQINDYINSNLRLAIFVAAATQVEERQQQLRLIKQNSAEIEHLIQTISDRVTLEEERLLLQNVRQSRERWLNTLSSHLNQLDVAVTEYETQLLLTNAQLLSMQATRTLTALNELRHFQNQQMTEQQKSLEQFFWKSLWLFTIAILLLLILLISLNSLTLKYLRHVFHQIRIFSSELAKGNTQISLQNNQEQGDIGELYKALEQTRHRLQQLFTTLQSELLKAKQLQQAVNQSSNTIVITDLQAKIIYVNQAFTKTTGYTLEEVLGKTPKILQSGQTPLQVYRQIRYRLQQGKTWQGTLVNRTKEGSFITERVKISPVLNDQGHPECFLAVKEDITELNSAQERIERMAYFDTLTDLPNRHRFLEVLQQCLDLQQFNFSFNIFFIDLNRFKEINDTQGHSIGDQVLQEISNRLAKIFWNEIIFARLGGDEFVVLSENVAQAQINELIDKTEKVLATPISVGQFKFNLGASIGIANYPRHGKTSQDLLRKADIAMYKAKEQHLLYCLYSDVMGKKIEREHLLIIRLKQALNNSDGLTLHLQPQFSMQGEMVGAEVLLRWHESELGFISPGEFISLAEQKGLIEILDQWVITATLSYLQQLQHAGIRFPGRLAINISAQSIQRPDFAEEILAKLALFRINGEILELEITESGLMADPIQALENAKQCQQAGIALAIDDFGTGYSSLAYLKQFKAAKLKIDRSFISAITHSNVDQTIVKTTILMAEALAMKTIAEGVETTEQLNILTRLGCNLVQGYLTGRPVATDEFNKQYLFVS